MQMFTSQPKPTLSALQGAMARAVMHPLGAREEMDIVNSELAAAIIKPNGRLTSFERLQIYNQQYWWRLLGSFGEDFPGLRAVLGQRKFDRVALAYLRTRGSTSWNLRDLGQHLEAFLCEHSHFAAPHEQLALDMVRVEWARVVAFDGGVRPPLQPESLVGRAPSRIRLDLQPCMTLLALHHPIDDLLRRLKLAERNLSSEGSPRAGGLRRVRLRARSTEHPIYLAVHRMDLSVYYKRLEPAAYRLLAAIRTGATLDVACADAFQDSRDQAEDPAARIQAWFAEWTGCGWLCERQRRLGR